MFSSLVQPVLSYGCQILRVSNLGYPQVSESTAEVMMGWIRFVVKDSTAPAVELTIQVNIVAADPVAWGMAIVAGNSQPTPRDQGEVQCGQPFTLEVCAHDKFGHR